MGFSGGAIKKRSPCRWEIRSLYSDGALDTAGVKGMVLLITLSIREALTNHEQMLPG